MNILVNPIIAQAQSVTWEAPYRGDDPTLLYLPDTKATYWRYGWKREVGDTRGIVLRGDMPDARYFSYNVYDDNTKSTMGSLTDFQIVAENGAGNPFAGEAGSKRANYEIYVLPEGTKTEFKNVLYFPDELTNVSVFLRYYVAQNGFEGGVPTPQLQAYEPTTKTISTAPPSSPIPALSAQEMQQYLVPMLKTMAKEIEENPKVMIEKYKLRDTSKPINLKELIASQVVKKSFNLFAAGAKQNSFRFQTAGTYPNQDNYYLGLPIIRNKNQSLLVRFKVPERVSSATQYPDADVRYFSLSQGDEFSYTHETIMDSEMIVDAEGFANFIVADDTPQIAAVAKALGVNFMPWRVKDKILLIYRHMLPNKDFENGIDKVTTYDPSQPLEDQIASKTIGAYAMVGKLVESTTILSMSEFPRF